LVYGTPPHGDPDHPWHVYLQDRHKNIALSIREGDRVFFYETKTNNNVKYKNVVGRMGLVHVGTVTGKAYTRESTKAHQTYTDGARKNWSTGIPTNAGETKGYVTRENIVKILGYRDNYFFKGFAGGAGIKQIDATQARALLELFETL